MKTTTRGESPLSATFCSPFFVCGEGKNRVAIHRDRITMIHDEGDVTLLKLDMGSGNYETIRRIEMPFDEVMGFLANEKLSD